MSKVETKEIVMYQHLNRRGTLFGGQLMSWMDLAAAMVSHEIANQDCVTVAVDAIEFKKPVQLGELVTLQAESVKEGTTSIQVKVVAYKSNFEEKMIEVASSLFTFVCVDKDGKPKDWRDGGINGQ